MDLALPMPFVPRLVGQRGAPRGRLACLVIAGLLLGTATGCSGRDDDSASTDSPGPAAEAPPQSPDFSPEVQAVLASKIALLEELAQQPRVIEAAKLANRETQYLSMKEIERLDRQWSDAQGLNDLIKSKITNKYAQFLVDFQERNGGFPEIFLTDRRGLIAAETNKTSDYYQADEPWWQQTFAKGRGHSHHGEIEYDRSARSEAISVYVPVIDPESGQAIGVIKAVCDITALKMEL